MRFEVGVGDTPVLNRHIGTQEFRAVACTRLRGQLEIIGLETIGLAVPMDMRSAETGARQERFPPPDRQCRLPAMVAEGNRLARIVLHQRLADVEAQLVVNRRALEVGHGEAGLAALQADYLIAGCSEFL